MALINITAFSDTENQSFTDTGIDATFNGASPGQWNFASRTYTDEGTFAIDPVFFGVGNGTNFVTLDQNAGNVASAAITFTVLTGTFFGTVQGITGNQLNFNGVIPPTVTFSVSWNGIQHNSERVRFVHQGYDNAAVTSIADYNFTDCSWEDSGDVSLAASNALGAGGVKNYNWTRTLFVSTTNQDTAFGESGTTYTNNVAVTDCIFAGYGNSKWFINLAGVDASALPGTQLKNTGVNTPSRGISFNGLSFDGSVRAEGHNRNGYTVRCVGGTANRSNNFMTNFQVGDLGQYNEGNSSTPQGTFSSHSSWATSDNIYLINNQYQYAQVTPAGDTAFTIFSSGGDATFREAYHWRPSFVRPDQTTATDIKFIDMLSTTGADVLVKQMPLSSESSDTNLTDVASNNDLYLPGYVVEVANGVSGDATLAVTAALQFDAGTNTHTLKGQFVITPFAKSFTDIVPIEVTSQVTEFTTDPATFAVTSQVHAIPSASDLNLNGKTVTTALEVANSASDLYPQAKATWYNSAAAGTLEAFEPTIANGILSTNKTIVLGDGSAYGADAIGFNVGPVIASSLTIREIDAASIEIAGRGFNGITIAGATTGNFGALSNGADIETSNTAAHTIVSMDSSTFNATGASNLNITGNSASSIITTLGNIDIDGTSTSDELNGVDINIDGATDDADINATGNVTIEAVTGSQTTVDGVNITTGAVTGGTYTSTGTTSISSADGGVFNSTGNFTSTGSFDNATLIGSANALLDSTVSSSTVTANNIDLNGDATNTTFTGNMFAEGRTLTGVTLGAGTHDLRATTFSGGTLTGTVDLGSGNLTNNVTLLNPTITTTLTDITAWSTNESAATIVSATANTMISVTQSQAEAWTAGTNVTFVTPDLIITVDSSNITNPFYSLYVGDTFVSSGAYTSAFTITQLQIGSGDWTLAVVAADGVEQIFTGNYAGGSQTVTPANNPLFNATGTSDVGSLSINSGSNASQFLINIGTGAALAASEVNTSFFSFKSSTQYATYIMGVYRSEGTIFRKTLSSTGLTDVVFLNDGTNTVGLVVTAGSGAAAPLIQNGRYYNGTSVVDLEAEETVFNTAVVTPLSGSLNIGGSTSTVNLGVVPIPGTQIDYNNVGNQVTARLIEYDVATGGDVGDEIETVLTTLNGGTIDDVEVVGTNQRIDAIKVDTEATLDATQQIIES